MTPHPTPRNRDRGNALAAETKPREEKPPGAKPPEAKPPETKPPATNPPAATELGEKAPPVARVSETHTAVVLLLGDHAYKVKKPVDLGFLDFTTVAARRETCRREVELNRRFAPDVYEGVAELTRDWDEAPPEPVVVMRRLPDDRRLSRLVAAGAPVDGALRAVARTLAACHAASPRTAAIDAQGTREALRARWEASFRQVAEVAAPGTPAGLDEVRRLAREYLAGRNPLFEARIRAGRIVDGHGDLLAEDVFCLDDGPRVLDCLEFDDTLRHVDGLDDAAFLAMDLEHLGAPDAAARFLARYRQFSGDPAPPSLCHHYLAYRAFVRAKVMLLRAAQAGRAEREEARARAEEFTELAARHLRAGAVRLVLVGGPPASGKSTLAGALADRLGLTVLGSDRVRKELAGLPPGRPAAAAYREGIYSAAWSRRTYAELLDRASALLGAGESVVLDAGWGSHARREAAAMVAERCG
ncbi:AAA family ATPase, partial [Streptomyces sp. SM12]|uniref:bifunctional aminoglycoside phosphotransferase/ATP-binding protein n=1 Tax=Streptomyces sp. SM12 TaxID=1071602 RepID=UPI0011B0F1FE